MLLFNVLLLAIFMHALIVVRGLIKKSNDRILSIVNKRGYVRIKSKMPFMIVRYCSVNLYAKKKNIDNGNHSIDYSDSDNNTDNNNTDNDKNSNNDIDNDNSFDGNSNSKSENSDADASNVFKPVKTKKKKEKVAVIIELDIHTNSSTAISIDKKGKTYKPSRKQDYTFYKLVCKDVNAEKVFVGCTGDFLHIRMIQHKSQCHNPKNRGYNKLGYQYIRANGGWNKWDYEIMEECESIDREEARKILLEWINNTPNNLNIKQPITSHEEDKIKNAASCKKYNVQNKDKISELKRVYHKNNRDAMVANHRIYNLAHKEERKAYDAIPANKDRRNATQKKLRDVNKDKLSAKASEKKLLDHNKETNNKSDNINSDTDIELYIANQ